MDLQAFRKKYSGLSQRDARHLIETEPSFRNETEALYRHFFHADLNKKCPDCWMDAFIALIKTNIDKLMEQSKAQFKLKAGALLRDIINPNDDTKLCSRANLTDELAFYHLMSNPACIRKFEVYPADWEAQVNARFAAPKKAAGAPSNTKADQTHEEKEKAAEKAVKSAKSRISACETNLRKATEAEDQELIDRRKASLDNALAKFENAKKAFEAIVGKPYEDGSKNAPKGQE